MERTLMDWAVMLAALPVVVAYLCRLRLLNFWEHRLLVVAMHLALFVSAVGAAVTAWQGLTELQTLMSLAAAGLWIVVSLATWGTGVPPHARRRPPPPDTEPESAP